MSPEDKGVAPYDNAASGQTNEEGSSLSARRARLRGSLSKQATPPDPYAVSALEPPASSTPTPIPPSIPTSAQDQNGQNGQATNGDGHSATAEPAAAPPAAASSVASTSSPLSTLDSLVPKAGKGGKSSGAQSSSGKDSAPNYS